MPQEPFASEFPEQAPVQQSDLEAQNFAHADQLAEPGLSVLTANELWEARFFQKAFIYFFACY